MREKLRQAPHDRQAEFMNRIARGLAGGTLVVEDRLQRGAGHEAAVGPDLDAEPLAAPAAAEQHLAASGLPDGVRQKIADHLLEQAGIAADDRAAADDAQHDSLRLGLIGEGVAQPFENLRDRKLQHFGVDGAGLDLVDVEQRVEHARHRADRLVDLGEQLLRLLALDLLGEQALKQSERLHRLAEVVARRREETRFRGAGPLGRAMSGGERLGRAHALGDVGEGDHDALAFLVPAAIARNPAQEMRAVGARDLALDRRGIAQHLARVVEQGVVARERAQIESGRPRSLGITWNSALVAGVKKRMLSAASRNSVATSVLSSRFCRSSALLRWRSSVSRRRPLSAVSSAFRDSSASIEVESS